MIGAVTGYAAHVSDKNGTWKEALWQIATGDHWWNDTDTYSYHYMYVENRSNTWVDLTYKWIHQFKQGNIVLKSDQIWNRNRPLRIGRDNTYSTSGWLNTHTSGGIPDGNIYHIVSTTKIKMENGHGFTSIWYEISHTTRVDLE